MQYIIKTRLGYVGDLITNIFVDHKVNAKIYETKRLAKMFADQLVESKLVIKAELVPVTRAYEIFQGFERDAIAWLNGILAYVGASPICTESSKQLTFVA